MLPAAADITDTVNQFRDVVGTLNPNQIGSFGVGRREINWDGVPAARSAPNNLPADFFNVNSPRGVVFSTPGSGFQVSGSTADAGAGQPSLEFANLNPTYPTLFNAFSAQRLFTPVGSNVMDFGTISLTTSPTSAIWTAVTAGMPGDRATGTLTATNAGSGSLRYAVTGGVTNATAAAAMNLRVGLRGGGSCDFPYHNTDGTNTTLTDDTQLYTGLLSTAALIGSTAQGNQAGDRTLAASATEPLCFAVVAPLSTGNTLQGQTNTTTFTFESEQTASNP